MYRDGKQDHWGKEVDVNRSVQANFCSLGPVLYDTVMLDTGLQAFVKTLKTLHYKDLVLVKKIQNQTGCPRTSRWHADCHK